VGSIGTFFGQLFGPVGAIFHVVFYLPIYNVLMLLYEGVHALSPALPAYAIAIFFLTVIIRLALFPLTRKQLASSRRMQELAPQIQELQRRHKGNPQELYAAQQALYREHGVSMYGGCLPLLIQMPFLYGLYFSLSTALLSSGKNESVSHHLQRVNNDIYPFLPHLSALPNTHFLWTNLAQADPWHVLPVLAGLLTFVQLRMAMPVKKPGTGGKQSDPNSQAMGTMQFVMPFITFFMALSFPSGLAFYWTISTGFSAVQQYFISGWGSLFVGIPGMEHLVPAPATPVPTVSSSTRMQSALVDSSSPTSRPTGMAGLRQMIADMAAARAQPQDKTPPGEAGPLSNPSSGKKAVVESTGDGTGNAGTQNGNGAKAAPAVDAAGRRNRPARQGPTLVKPVTPGSVTAPTTNGQSSSSNEKAQDSLNGAAPTNGASKAGGADGSAKGSSQAGGAGASGTQPARPADGQQRSGPGGSAARKRPTGKPKGGR
jgi:YidC/Oxa1 family membrane protein insertase